MPLRTYVELVSRDDDLVRVYSEGVGGGVLCYHLGEEARRGRWLDYLQGVTHVLGLQRGFDLHVRSTLPLGGGLSSSASFLVAVLRGLREAFELAVDDRTLALLAHRAETEFVGAPVGMMDPFAVHFADETSAILLDVRDLSFERIPLPPALGLVILDSGVHHKLTAQGGYRTRRAECEAAASRLGVRSLRELGDGDAARIAALPDPLDRRVRHVVEENKRVLAAAQALRGGDLEALGALFAASHRSMRDDYEVSVPAVDALVARAQADPAVYGARLTGGGFGGSVVIATDAAQRAEVAARIAGAAGGSVRILVPSPGGRTSSVLAMDPE